MDVQSILSWNYKLCDLQYSNQYFLLIQTIVRPIRTYRLYKEFLNVATLCMGEKKQSKLLFTGLQFTNILLT